MQQKTKFGQHYFPESVTHCMYSKLHTTNPKANHVPYYYYIVRTTFIIPQYLNNYTVTRKDTFK